MIFLAVLVAAVFMFLLQQKIYKKFAFDKLEYSVSPDVKEIFEDDELYIYEEIKNNKWLPLPFLKVDTELPEGLVFCILERNKKGELVETYPRIIHSLFVVKGNQMIRRRWKIRCDVRGTYPLGNVTMYANDIFGSVHFAKVFEVEKKAENTLVVLPKAIDLKKEYVSSRYISGEYLVERSLLTDPLLKAGARDYTAGDPINRINWKQTAIRGSLMVNLEEYTNTHMFNIVMNMQAREMEKYIPGPPSSKDSVERCISVVASILDGVAHENTPVRVISNTPPENISSELCAAFSEDDFIGKNIFVSEPYSGTTNIITALRMLAQLELYVSIPIEKMLDHIVSEPYAYTNGGNMIFVSSYISERMINFCYEMRRRGITVIFYVTSLSINAQIIPDDIEVHFRAY